MSIIKIETIGNNNKNKNYKKNLNNKIHNDYYCHICRTKGHSTDHCKYHLLIKENNKSDDNNNKSYNTINNKNKKFSIGQSKNNYYSGNIINYNKNDNRNNNNSNFFSKIMMAMKMKYISILQEVFQSFKTVIIQRLNNNTNSTHQIIEDGTGINLTNNINNLNKLNEVNNKNYNLSKW